MAFKEKKQSIQRDDSTQSEFVRRFKANPFVFIGTIIVLIIVIVAFVFVPAIVPQAGGSNTELNFGSYNKVPIKYVPGNYFSQIQGNIARYYQSTLDESNYQYAGYQIWRQAYEETVIHTAILNTVKRAGYQAPKDLVDKEVALLPQFQENGRFSIAKYRQMDNTSLLALWREVQDSIAEEHYREDISGLRIPSREGDFIAAMASPQRSFDMAVFPMSAYPNSEISAYVSANPGLFRVTHLSKITITASEKKAREILDQVKDGTLTFEDAVKLSEDSYADRGGDLGLKMVYELTAEVPDTQEREAVAALSVGNYSPIVKVPSGWAFFRSEVNPYAVDTTDTANLDKIRSYLGDFERGRIDDWLIAQADAFVSLVRQNDFDTAAILQGIEKQSFGPLPINYGARSYSTGTDGVELFTTLASFSIPELAYAGSNENFWRTAFFTPVGTSSRPIVIGSNVIVLYPREEITASPDDTDTIKSIYMSYWQSSNAEQSLRSYFIDNEKHQDQFYDTYFKLFSGSSGF
ncbi:hypothetical protein FACS189483_05330 [Spirochaetia bacterium]|nr:hypothetical protein FACS189483_05330 [Spirochaetia bacterium]